jgi:hypothetical protein
MSPHAAVVTVCGAEPPFAVVCETSRISFVWFSSDIETIVLSPGSLKLKKLKLSL